MSSVLNDRVAIVMAPTTIGVTLQFGETVVSLRLPRPAGDAAADNGQIRAAALRSAKRALEVALEEVNAGIG